MKKVAFTMSVGENDYYTFNGHILTVSGYYNDTLQSVVTGCDSILTLHLQVLPIYTTYISDTICAGTTYNQNGFNYIHIYPPREYSCDSRTGDDSVP